MNCIGIRVEPSRVWFAIYNAQENVVVNVEYIRIPHALETPEALKYVRSNVLDILREYEIENAGIRETEPNAQHPNAMRMKIEAVIQEAFASSCVKAFYVGHVSSISSRLDIDRTEFKPFIKGETDPGIENWDQLSEPQREALLCAKGAKNA